MLKKWLFQEKQNWNDLALLILRVGVGASFIFHGWPKLIGGPDKWARLGRSMDQVFSISIFPEFWGFLAAFFETAGGLALILGLFIRFFGFGLSFTMLVAFLKHLFAGDGFGGFSHAFELMIVFVALTIIGPSKYTLDRWLMKRR